MTDILKPRWLLALLACAATGLSASARPTDPHRPAPMQAPDSSEVVFRHYL